MKKTMMPMALVVSAFFMGKAGAQTLEYCYAPPDSKTYLQKTIGPWKIIKSKCSCSATTIGKPSSMLVVHATRASVDQREPILKLLVFLDKKLKKPVSNIPVKVDGFDVESETEGQEDIIASELKIDLLETISSSNQIEIGPYKFALRQSSAAVNAMMSCYGTLTGK
ncbi:hypothetical protein ABE562_05000 [Brucella intermedia]|uniref:Uncharacterized protein n=1 Tax=Brucella intermedia GD04153 TaxID=2975438 RepID=A0AA42KKW1_9HYPH|nr:hypothetical protein [Brucella intermedia]MDH0123324.1 hypothetical protein [Brucella intermedia GD04153]